MTKWYYTKDDDNDDDLNEWCEGAYNNVYTKYMQSSYSNDDNNKMKSNKKWNKME